MKILVMHGPNLNLLGEREPGIYGSDTFESVNAEIKAHAEKLGFECEVFQSNSEGALIDRLHAARLDCAGACARIGEQPQRTPKASKAHWELLCQRRKRRRKPGR